MAEQVQLRDGTGAWVWPLLRTDRAMLIDEFERLSPESRRRRFLSPVVNLSDEMWDHLVYDVDGIHHVALVLFAENGDAFDPVGIARMARYADVPDAADLGISVRDDWQGRGVASALLPVLMRQRPRGVTRIVTDMSLDNPASLKMLEALGPTEATYDGHGLYEVTVDISTWPREPTLALTHPESPAVTEDPVAAAGIGRAASPFAKGRPGRRAFRTRDRICPWLN